MSVPGYRREATAQTASYTNCHQDYLKETVHDTFRFISVSLKGIKFLSTTDKMDGTPLVLQLTAEMIDLEEHGSSQHKGGGLNHVTTSCVNQGCSLGEEKGGDRRR